jgi:hypothetical protein
MMHLELIASWLISAAVHQRYWQKLRLAAREGRNDLPEGLLRPEAAILANTGAATISSSPIADVDDSTSVAPN